MSNVDYWLVHCSLPKLAVLQLLSKYLNIHKIHNFSTILKKWLWEHCQFMNRKQSSSFPSPPPNFFIHTCYKMFGKFHKTVWSSIVVKTKFKMLMHFACMLCEHFGLHTNISECDFWLFLVQIIDNICLLLSIYLFIISVYSSL